MEGVSLPIARGIKGELGVVIADKAIIPHSNLAWTMSYC